MTRGDEMADLGKRDPNAMSDEGQTQSASNRLFDLRELIFGLFVVFGAILVVAGIFDSQAEIDKAAGVRINLWAGIGMILLGLVFLAWRLWKPLRREDLVATDDDEGGGAPADPISGH